MPSCVTLCRPLPWILKPRFKNLAQSQEEPLTVIELVSDKARIQNCPGAPPYRFPWIVWELIDEKQGIKGHQRRGKNAHDVSIKGASPRKYLRKSLAEILSSEVYFYRL